MALDAQEPLFVFGTLRDTVLLETVAGGPVRGRTAVLPGYRVATAKGQSFPILVARDGSTGAKGLLLDLTPEQAARVDYYEAPYGYTRKDVTVQTDDGEIGAQVYMPPDGQWEPDGAWNLEDWQDFFGDVMAEAATEIMEGFGTADPEDIAKRFSVIRTRAQQRCNAREQFSPSVLRQKHTRSDVELIENKQSYSHFFELRDVMVKARQFDGEMSSVMDRAVFVTADAVTVLPYDPGRDRVLLIEQFRAATYMRGDPNPWSLEVIAGRQDVGEPLETAARREALEEAGLELGALHKIASYYSSPGANTEYLTSYLGIADLPDGIEGVGGLESEAEDIRSMLVSFDTLMQAILSGEAENAPLIMSALWLARKRADLRA